MDDQTIFERNTARSGNIDYLQPIIIRGGPTKRTHFEVLPSFFSHSDGRQELCLKLSYWKATKNGIRTGIPADFTLNNAEVGRLLDTINQGLALCGEARSGRFFTVRIDDESAAVEGGDVATVAKAVTNLLRDQALSHVVATQHDAVPIIEGLQSIIRLNELRSSIKILKGALARGEVAEQWYQVWCEENAWAFGNAYTMRDSVRDIALGDSVDGLLERTSDRLRDIYELKRPDHEVIRWDSTHKCWYWSSDVSKTVGQCHRYLDALHEAAGRGLRDHPELVAYYPYATIVIGRSDGWSNDKLHALHGLNHRLHGIRVMTYDHLAAQAERSLHILSDEAERP